MKKEKMNREQAMNYVKNMGYDELVCLDNNLINGTYPFDEIFGKAFNGPGELSHIVCELLDLIELGY